MRRRVDDPQPAPSWRRDTPAAEPEATTSNGDLTRRILQLQLRAGNRAVSGALGANAGPIPGTLAIQRAPQSQPPPVGYDAPAVQRAPTTYDPGESEKATDRGILDRDVSLLGAVGSGYNASAESVLVADFRPNSATVRTSAREQLTSGSWLKILESNRSDQYALLGFTDATGPQESNDALRSARAAAIANLLPGTARRGVVGPAPTGAFIAPGNATAEQRALNRSVLIRLPFAELRETSQVDKYAQSSVDFVRANPTKTVADLVEESGKKAAARLERNNIPPPPFVSGTVPRGSDTLAFFTANDWKVTADVAALAADTPQTGVTPTTKLSTLTPASVGKLVQACYHEARHAEQTFLAARMEAEQTKGALTASTLSRRLGIKQEIAEAAISAAMVTMPDVLKTKAEAWRTFMVGGRHIPYRTWNKEVQDQISVLLTVGLSTMTDFEDKTPYEIRLLWEHLLHPTLDRSFRKNLSYRADVLLKDLKASPHQDAVDLDVRSHLEKTAQALFMVLVKERGGASLPTVDTFTKLSTDDADKARSDAKIWLLELESGLIGIKLAADEAYRAYPQEKDAYETGEMVSASVIEHAAP